MSPIRFPIRSAISSAIRSAFSSAGVVRPEPVAWLTITGTTTENQTLTAALSGAPTITAYQWLRGYAPISGATSSTYVLTDADVGRVIRVVATHAGGEGYSPPTAIISGVGGRYSVADLGSMYQDTGGATPAVVNAKVARMLDVSGKGNHLTQATESKRPYLRGSPVAGPINGQPEFYSATSWTFGAGWAHVKPAAVATASSGTLVSGASIASGKSYLVTATVSAFTSGSVTLSLGGVSLPAMTAAGSIFRVVDTVSAAALTLTAASFTGTVRSVYVYDVSSGSVKAPYWLEFDGVDDSLDLGGSIAHSYPLSIIAQSMHDSYAGGLLGAAGLYNSPTDYKHVRGYGVVVDKGASELMASFTAQIDTVLEYSAEFSSGTVVGYAGLIFGSSSVNTNTFGTKPQFFVGKGRDSDIHYSGRIYDVNVMGAALSDSERRDAMIALGSDKRIEAWGDSMTIGSAGAVEAGGFVKRARTRINKHIENEGQGGQTSSQITTRFNSSSSERKRHTQIFWMGTNNMNDTAQIKADIATCVAGLNGHSRFVVIAPTLTVGQGGAGGFLPALLQLEADLLALYGSKFLDLRAHLGARHDWSDNDLADIADGYYPRSLRIDNTHLNDMGYQHTADAVVAKLVDLGCADAQVRVNSAPTGSLTISGVADYTETLTANTGGLSDADGLGSFTYAWLRDGVVIGGATSSTYTLIVADIGTLISVRVRYVDGYGFAESVTSAAVGPVTGTPPAGWNALDSAGASYAVSLTVLDSAGASYTVASTVKDSAGNSYTPA